MAASVAKMQWILERILNMGLSYVNWNPGIPRTYEVQNLVKKNQRTLIHTQDPLEHNC